MPLGFLGKAVSYPLRGLGKAGDVVNPYKWRNKYRNSRTAEFVSGEATDRGANEFRDVDPMGDLQRFGDRGAGGFYRTGQDMQRLQQQLEARASGQAPSLSGEQLRQNLQRNLSSQRAAAASARPGNQAMAARNAAQQMGRLQAGLAGQQAMAGIAERQAAQAALQNLLERQRQQDLAAAQFGYGGIESARTQRFGSLTGTPTRGEGQLGLLGGIVGAAAKSDKRAKTNIRDGGRAADEFLRQLKAHTYDYKDPKDGPGTQLGIMAQDLEKSKLGKAAVIDTPQGKMVHGARLATQLAAALARVNDRVKELEGK